MITNKDNWRAELKELWEEADAYGGSWTLEQWAAWGKRLGEITGLDVEIVAKLKE